MVQTSQLRGCSKMGLGYAHPILQAGNRETIPDYVESDAEVMRGWGVKLMRLDFTADWYLENTENYRDYVKQWVNAYTNRGMSVILDCHYPTRMEGLLASGTPDEEAYAMVEPMMQALEMATRDFFANAKVIGVEINEPWLMDDEPDRQHFWMLKMYQRLARRIHIIKPTHLIFMDICNMRWMSETALQDGVKEVTEPNLVLAYHIYDAQQTDLPFMQTYQSGDYAKAKLEFYDYLNYYFKRTAQIYHLPVVVTEFCGKRGVTQALKDLMDYMNNEGWGYSYWSYYGQTDGDALLEEDWTTLSPTGKVYVENLPAVTPSACFIATACGTSNSHLDTLRGFRDRYLPHRLVNAYYLLSPPVADRIREHESVKTVIRGCVEWSTCQLKKSLTL